MKELQFHAFSLYKIRAKGPWASKIPKRLWTPYMKDPQGRKEGSRDRGEGGTREMPISFLHDRGRRPTTFARSLLPRPPRAFACGLVSCRCPSNGRSRAGRSTEVESFLRTVLPDQRFPVFAIFVMKICYMLQGKQQI